MTTFTDGRAHLHRAAVLLVAAVLSVTAGVAAADEPRFEGLGVAEWAERLGATDRAPAAFERLATGGLEARPVLLRLLRDPGASVRAAAAEALRGTRDDPEPAIAPLTAALADPVAPVRAEAAGTLGTFGPAARSAVPALVECLDDPDRTVRTAAIRALGDIGPDARGAIPRLLAAVRGEASGFARDAARALAGIGPEAIRALVAALRGPEPDPVIRALAVVGADAAPLLEPLLRAEDAELRARAERAFAEIGWRGVAELGPRAPEDLAGRVREATLLRAAPSVLAGWQLRVPPPPEVDPARLTVTIESSSGHGFTLTLARLRFAPEGLAVRRIRYAWRRGEAGEGRVLVETGFVPAPRADWLAGLLVGAASLGLEEVPHEGPVRMTSSSANAHYRLRIEDERGVRYDAAWAGYGGTTRDPDEIRLRTADRIWREAIEDVRFLPVAPEEEDLEHLLARLARFGEDAWWVRERLLLVVGALGDERFLPFLRRVIEAPLEPVVRRTKYAIDAYARISGVDLRPTPFTEDDVPAVRDRYLASFPR